MGVTTLCQEELKVFYEEKHLFYFILSTPLFMSVMETPIKPPVMLTLVP